MIKANYLSSFEVYRVTPPIIMPEHDNNRKKNCAYMVLAPTIKEEFDFLSKKQSITFRNLYKYFVPKRFQLTLYGQGNKIIKLNEDGDINALLETYAKKGAFSKIDTITSYIETYSGRPLRDMNVLVEANYIFEIIMGNPRDKRYMSARVADVFKHLSDLYQKTLKVGGQSYLGNYTNSTVVIPTSLWFDRDEFSNPELLFKKTCKNPMGHFLGMLCDKKNLAKFDTIMLVDNNVILCLDANSIPDKAKDTIIHDMIVRYMKKVHNVVTGNDDEDEDEDVIISPDAKKDGADIARTNLAAAEQRTRDTEAVDTLLKKADVEPDSVSAEKKEEIKKIAKKVTPKTTPAEVQTTDNDDVSSVTEPMPDAAAVTLEDMDVILSAKVEGRSIASQKRNEILKTKYRELRLGDIPITQLIETEERYEIPKIAAKSHTINDSLKNIKAREFERAYNENIAQYDFANILLHFSKVNPPLYLNKDIKVEDASTPTDRLIRYTVEFEDENRKRHHFSFLMPKMYRDKYLYLNDQEMNLIHQKFPFPITKIGKDRCQLVTNYKKIISERYGGNLSPRITKIKKVFCGADCPKSIKAEPGNGSIPNGPFLTTVEYDELSEYMVRLQMAKTTSDMLTIYFIVNDAMAVIPNNSMPKTVQYTTYGEDGVPVTTNIEDHTLLPLAIKKNRTEKTAQYFYISGTTNRVYTDGGIDCGELSDFIVNSAYTVDSSLEKIFDDTSAGTKFVYARSTILAECIPTVLVASAADPGGLIGVLNKGKIKYQFQEKRPTVNKDVTGVIPFSDGYLIYDRYPYENSLLLNGLLTIPTKEFSWFDMASRDTYVEIFDLMFNRRTLIDGLTNFYYMMIDPITKDILQRLGMPTDFTMLLLYCVGTLADNTFQIDSSYENSRIRSNEIINAYLYQALATSWEQWNRGKLDKFSIRERAVIDELLQAQIVDPHSKLNVTLEVENDSQVKIKGPSGMNEDHAFTIEKRAYHPTMKGIIAMNSTASGEVGICRHLTLNANIDNVRGFVTLNKDSYDGTELTSPGELLQTFGPESADIERVAMAISQSKHLIPVKSQTSGLVSYDMERTIPYISNDFAFRAKKSGKVVEIKDDLMIIQYSDGTYDDVDLSRHPDKNVDGGFYVMNQMTTTLKVGQKFDENEILAYDQKYINNNDMFGDPCANVGCLARVSIETNGAVFEDSGYVTDDLAHRLTAKITRKKTIVLSKFANIKYIAKPGQHIQANDPLLTFDDTADEFSSQLLSSIADEQEDEDEIIATSAPVISKVTGTITDIFIYYTVPLEELTPSMRKVIEDYNKSVKSRERTLAKYCSTTDPNTILKPAEKLKPDASGKVKGIRVGDGVIIDFYIEYDDVVAAGDKLSSFSALKTIVSFVVPDEYAPYTEFNPERKIGIALACVGMYKRMCLDLIKVGGITKFLIEMKRLHKLKYAERIKAELKKK